MDIRIKVLSMSLACLCYLSANATDCLKYEPDVVALTGLLHRATFPGKPNFESVANGDEPETGFYLTLKQRICTQQDSGPDRQGHDAVTEVQLVLTPEQYDLLRPQIGKQVVLRGQLFSSFTGHHHTDVLLRVTP
jgi:hypothetical protein